MIARFKTMVFACTLGLLSLAFGLTAQPASAVQLGNIRVISGMATSEVTLTPHSGNCAGVGSSSYWHCDETDVNESNVALDMTNALGATAGTAVYLQTYGYAGYAFGYTRDHIGSCPGVDVSLWIPYPTSEIGTWIGSVNYVQFPPSIMAETEIYIGASWTFTYLGTILSGAACALSDGPHLHQSGTPGFHVATNTPVTADDDPGKSGVQIWATGSYYDNWLHNIAY